MQSKGLVLAGLLLLALLASRWSVQAQAAPKDIGSHLELIPATLSGMEPIRRWRHTLSNPGVWGVEEDGALYAVGVGRKAHVMVDYFRGAPMHNGAECFVLQGESIVREQKMQVATRSGPVEFVVATLRNGGHLRLAASTQCRADGCRASPLRLGMAPTAASVWNSLSEIRVGRQPSQGDRVVSMSMMVEYPDLVVGDRENTEAHLVQDFQKAAYQLDFTNARELAGLFSPSSKKL